MAPPRHQQRSRHDRGGAGRLRARQPGLRCAPPVTLRGAAADAAMHPEANCCRLTCFIRVRDTSSRRSTLVKARFCQAVSTTTASSSSSHAFTSTCSPELTFSRTMPSSKCVSVRVPMLAMVSIMRRVRECSTWSVVTTLPIRKRAKPPTPNASISAARSLLVEVSMTHLPDRLRMAGTSSSWSSPCLAAIWLSNTCSLLPAVSTAAMPPQRDTQAPGRAPTEPGWLQPRGRVRRAAASAAFPDPAARQIFARRFVPLT